MNMDWFRDWKNGVKKLNETAKAVDKGRDEAYGIMSDKIKQTFSANGTVVNNVHFNNDGTVVTVSFVEEHEDTIKFSRNFLVSIGMPFAVKRKFTSLATNELIVELYPLEEE